MASRPDQFSEHSVPEASADERDQVFLAANPTQFRFDEHVARVFPDMLRRSIPGYSTLLHLIGVLAADVVKPSSLVYDLGCSLGAASLAIRHAVGARDTRIIAVDSSPAMVSRCRELLDADGTLCPVEVVEDDITNFELRPCSLVVLNFTLQFVPIQRRLDVIRRVSEALVTGGAVVLSEKTAEDEPRGSFLTRTHDSFRRSNGYSDLEISRKREALEKVLVPATPKTYAGWLAEAGLEPIEWFRCLQFVSWVGKKRC